MSQNVKPTHGEDDYFAKEDAEVKRKLALAVKKEMADAEARKLRELHHMHCPGCGQKMQEVVLRGVPVDVCFACNGVFLHRDELLAFQTQIIEGRRGVVAAILNWFHPETDPHKK
jgi:Zn-finger nucleic acid-binding protein